MSAAARWGDDTAPVAVPPTRPGHGSERPVQRFGPYRVVSKLGEGGMGVVYLALDPRGRAVAVKVLRAHIAYDRAARARLEREVDTLSLVRSPRVAAVIDADLLGDQPYVVTRYVGGPALDDVVTDEGPLSGAELVRLGRGLIDALDSIHDAGVIHRDLKPGNILLEDGEPVLIDFGIAHIADDVRLTSTGLVMGTPGYLSPEIIGGGEVSAATDWWGWAATMAFAATGRPPFGRGRMEVVLSRVSSGRPDLDGLDPRLSPLLSAALSPDPVRRPAATEVVEAMEDLLRPPGVGASSLAAGTASSLAAGTASSLAVGAAPTLRLRSLAQGDPAAPPPLVPVGTVGSVAPGASVGRAGAAGAAGMSAAAVRTGRPAPPPPATGQAAVPGLFDPEHPGEVPGIPDYWPGSTSALPVQAARGGVEEGVDEFDGELDEESDWQAAWESAADEPDPRIGRPMRTGTIAAMGGALVAGAATYPGVTLLVCLAWAWAARFSDRSVTSLVMRRYERGRRRSDVPMALVLSPWQLVVSAASTLVGLLLPLAVAVSGAFCASLVLSTLTGGSVQPAMGPALAAGFTVGALVAWWGPGGTRCGEGPARSCAVWRARGCRRGSWWGLWSV